MSNVPAEKSDVLVISVIGNEKQDPMSADKAQDRRGEHKRNWRLQALFAGLTFYCLLLYLRHSSWLRSLHRPHPPLPVAKAKPFCASIPPIGVTEFHGRQRALAHTLRNLNGSAYIAEPGANALYFANISARDWRTSERPFLLMITPDNGVTVLTPRFEETRARLLDIPATGGVTWKAWAEEADPFAVAVKALGSGTIFVDEAVRFFVADGLRRAGAKVEIAPPEIRALRERKSVAELALLTCVNEATLLALKDVRARMRLGITQSRTREMLREAMEDAGIETGWNIVLFGEEAARPHGGGNDRVLGKHDLILIDVGGQLHGYASDITRTFALRTSEIPSKHLEIWYIVQAAQAAALAAAKAGAKTGDVDKAARDIVNIGGYGEYFTHRLGHGIGLETHEDPYLVQRPNQQRIAPGNTFSNEPGIYIDGKVGVRLEDIFAIDEDGKAFYLTQAVGGAARSPWDP